MSIILYYALCLRYHVELENLGRYLLHIISFSLEEICLPSVDICHWWICVYPSRTPETIYNLVLTCLSEHCISFAWRKWDLSVRLYGFLPIFIRWHPSWFVMLLTLPHVLHLFVILRNTKNNFLSRSLLTNFA